MSALPTMIEMLDLNQVYGENYDDRRPDHFEIRFVVVITTKGGGVDN